MLWESASATDPGRVRQNNEDICFTRDDPGFFAVADGMGGHAAGEVASHIAMDTLVTRLDEAGCALSADDLARVFADANRAILARAAAEPLKRGMGTTLTVLAAVEEGQALVAHVGDSRLYRFRESRLEQLTRDHTWVQEHVDAGVLTEENARHHPFASVLTRVLGTTTSATPDIEPVDVIPDDLFLLCSDGLSGMVDDPDIDAILAGRSPLARMAEQLIDAANDNGGLDNVTLVLARPRHT